MVYFGTSFHFNIYIYIYINNIAVGIKSSILKFADDTKMYVKVGISQSIEALRQQAKEIRYLD